MRIYASPVLPLKCLLLAITLALPQSGISQLSADDWWDPSVRVLAVTDGRIFDWSPDGQRFAYANDSGIVILGAPDFAVQARIELAAAVEQAPVSDLRWAPDGQSLLYVSPWAPGEWTTIWAAAADGPVRDLLPPEVSDVFASTGIRAVYLSEWLNEQEVVFGQHCGPECTSLFKVNIDDRSYGRLCIASINGRLQWSRSRDRGVFPGHNGALGLVLAADFVPLDAIVQESVCRELLPGCTGGVNTDWFSLESWSPTGESVIVSQQRCDQGSAVYHPASGQLHQWTPENSEPADSVARGGLATWSPDGNYIALIRSTQEEDEPADSFDAELAVIEAGTRSVVTTVALGLLQASQDWELLRPAWSPDGRQIVFRDSQDNLRLIAADGSDPGFIVHARPSLAIWSPDSRRLAIRVAAQANYWLGGEAPFLIELE